ncbi:hypothetical protein NW762_008676 [Fusarium torreyae]|uniref:DhaK domain-containing protein n=1 Tax=Fusarium torreyae TaxID=1237075 RepID=A0A9W8RX22_9HYPO|nr:hypothetical protein NW762_008676 [Fusarium torreyae]
MSPLAAKHISQNPESLVKSALRSPKFLNPALVVDKDQKIVYLYLDKSPSNSRQQDMAIIAGGGSSHEPSFGGLILLVIDRVSTFSNKILATLMNFTGDTLNFGMAVEKAQAAWPELQTKMLVVADDVAVPRSSYDNVGRRGMAGTILVHKMTSAVAGLGYKMKGILEAGRLICDNLLTIGVALDRVQVPGRSVEVSPSYHLCSDEVGIGMGIYNEPGCARVSGLDAELGTLVKSSLARLLGTQDPERSFIKGWLGCAVLLVNNLGDLSVLDLGAALAEIVDQLHNNYNIQPKCIISGTYMTSLDCHGFSITLLNDISLELPHDVEELLDYPVGAVGWNQNTSLGRQMQALANCLRVAAVQKSNGKSDVFQ